MFLCSHHGRADSLLCCMQLTGRAFSALQRLPRLTSLHLMWCSLNRKAFAKVCCCSGRSQMQHDANAMWPSVYEGSQCAVTAERQWLPSTAGTLRSHRYLFMPQWQARTAAFAASIRAHADCGTRARDEGFR